MRGAVRAGMLLLRPLARRAAAAALRPRRLTNGTVPPRPQSLSALPFTWRFAAAYGVVGVAGSAYYLVTMDASEACAKGGESAWGSQRQLEGLDEVLGWLEWSALGAGVDAAPKLVRDFGAARACARALAGECEDVRSVAAGALASLTHGDALAAKIAATTDARAALVAELERIAPAELAAPGVFLGEGAEDDEAAEGAAERWAELYARRVAVLVALANLTRNDGV